jgi:hypothetical protein
MITTRRVIREEKLPVAIPHREHPVVVQDLYCESHVRAG